MSIYLNGLATAVPPYEMPQDVAEATARDVLGSIYAQFDRLVRTFKTSGVKTRYSIVPMNWFHEPKNWPQRSSAYIEGAKALFVESAQKALADAGWQADEVDTIVTISSTGIATPTLEALVWKEMGFRTDVHRVPVFGLGCAGGVSGLSIARAHAAAQPGSKVLMVAIEACSASFRSDRMQKADIIATVLFGDGAAAACLSDSAPNRRATVKLGLGQEEIWSDTLNIMGWDVDEIGFGVVFDRSIPNFTRQNLAGAAGKALSRSNLAQTEIDRFVCHPGGAKVVEAIEESFDLEGGILDLERGVLRDYGNMSAPTVLFVLDRLLSRGDTGQMMLSALGPGFTASFMPMVVGENHA